MAVYTADTFTAVNLLAYDKWSSKIEPAIPLTYSRWIFGVCIIISWALCAYEWFVAIRVIRRESVAESYMAPLAVTLQSMRPQGWKRFLVFGELTKSKKGTDYIALFVYFQFKGKIACANLDLCITDNITSRPPYHTGRKSSPGRQCCDTIFSPGSGSPSNGFKCRH